MIRAKTNVPGNESYRSIKQLALKVNDLVRSDRSTNKTKNFDGKWKFRQKSIVLTDPLYSLIAFVQFERRILKQFAKRSTYFNEVD